ncbi:MAG: hypothetical protein AAFX85_13925 [Pseudomonadota bacterium]
MRLRPSTQEDFLRWHFADNGVAELRHLADYRPSSGIFSNPEALLAATA